MMGMRVLRRNVFEGLLLALGLALVLAACSQGAAPSEEEGEVPAEEEEAEAEEEAEPAEAEEEAAEEETTEEETEEVSVGRTDDQLVVTYEFEPSVFDYHAFGTHGDDDVRMAVLDRLVNRDIVEGPFEGTFFAETGEYHGELAESWELDEETATLTFVLKDGITFSNGNPLTAEDVKFSFERSLLSPTSYAGSLLSLLTITDPEQIVVVDDRTVRFEMEEINPFLFELLSITISGITDKETVEEHATDDDPWATEWMATNNIGTGPYILTDLEPGVEYAFEPNPNYWNSDEFPRNGGVVIKVVPSPSDRILLLKSGDVDVVRGIPFNDVEDLQNTEGVKVLTYTSTDIRGIAINNNVPPFDDVRVRQAISYAIPYQDIIDTVYAGFATQLKGPIPEGMPTADPSVFTYETDLDKARDLLADAGYEDGFETTLFLEAENANDEQIALLIQDSLAEIGVDVQIERLLSGAFAQKQFGDRDMPLHFFSWISFVNDPFYHFHWLVRCDQGTNYANFCDPEIDALIDEGMFETDLDRRAEISRDIQQRHVEAATWIYTAQPDSVIAMRENVYGWTQHPDLVARYETLWKE